MAEALNVDSLSGSHGRAASALMLVHVLVRELRYIYTLVTWLTSRSDFRTYCELKGGGSAPGHEALWGATRGSPPLHRESLRALSCTRNDDDDARWLRIDMLGTQYKVCRRICMRTGRALTSDVVDIGPDAGGLAVALPG